MVVLVRGGPTLMSSHQRYEKPAGVGSGLVVAGSHKKVNGWASGPGASATQRLKRAVDAARAQQGRPGSGDSAGNGHAPTASAASLHNRASSASQSRIESRLGIVKKNRRSSSSSAPVGSLTSMDLTQDDDKNSRKKIAEFITKTASKNATTTRTRSPQRKTARSPARQADPVATADVELLVDTGSDAAKEVNVNERPRKRSASPSRASRVARAAAGKRHEEQLGPAPAEPAPFALPPYMKEVAIPPLEDDFLFGKESMAALDSLLCGLFNEAMVPQGAGRVGSGSASLADAVGSYADTAVQPLEPAAGHGIVVS